MNAMSAQCPDQQVAVAVIAGSAANGPVRNVIDAGAGFSKTCRVFTESFVQSVVSNANFAIRYQ